MSTITTQLNNLLKPVNNKVKRYSIEKFQLLNKKQFSTYFPDTDLKDYPEFTIAGMRVSVQLEKITAD